MDYVNAKVETVNPTKIFQESISLLLQEIDELKTRIIIVEWGFETSMMWLKWTFTLRRTLVRMLEGCLLQ